MEILDPDLWNDDGTPKKPTKEYQESLDTVQRGTDDAYLSYVRAKRELRENMPGSVGDVVHFWDDEKARCLAAIVMEIDNFSHACTLRVHVPHEAFQDWHVDHDESKGKETWHWPEDSR